MRWLDGITNSRNMRLSKLWEIMKDRGAWHPAIHGDTKSWIQSSDLTTTTRGQVCSFLSCSICQPVWNPQGSLFPHFLFNALFHTSWKISFWGLYQQTSFSFEPPLFFSEKSGILLQIETGDWGEEESKSCFKWTKLVLQFSLTYQKVNKYETYGTRLSGLDCSPEFL